MDRALDVRNQTWDRALVDRHPSSATLKMRKVTLDGYVAGPYDRPGRGLGGNGGMHLHKNNPAPVVGSSSLPNTPFIIAVYLAFAAIVLYPIASVAIPGLTDYPNHLARMHILATIDASADLRRYYEVHWTAMPYLAMDAMVPLIARVMPIYDAGRVFIGLCLLLCVAGTAALHYAVHRRASLVPLIAFLFSYNYLLSWGFLNYLFSVGLCLLLLAGWVATENWPRWLRAASFAVPALILYFSHIYGFAAYCLAVAGFEIGRAWRAGFRPIQTVAADWMAAAAQAVLPAIFLFMTDLSGASDGPALVSTSYGNIDAKLIAIESPFIFVGGRAEFAIAAIICVALIAGLLSGRLRLAPIIWPAAAAVAAVAIVTPQMLLNVFGVDFRLPLVVVLILISGISIRSAHPHPLLFLSVLVPLLAIKVWLAATVLQALDRQYADARQVISHLPYGARVLPARIDAQTIPSGILPPRLTMHMDMLAAIDRDAFVPLLFTGFTTIHTHDVPRNSSFPLIRPVPVKNLFSGLDMHGDLVTRDGVRSQRNYWIDWEDKYNFVLLQHSGAGAGTLPQSLTLIASSDTMNLYRINKPQYVRSDHRIEVGGSGD